MHNCKSCEHKELRYCPACSKVYCKCGKEWYEKKYSCSYPYQPWEPYKTSDTPDVTYHTYTDGSPSWIDN